MLRRSRRICRVYAGAFAWLRMNIYVVLRGVAEESIVYAVGPSLTLRKTYQDAQDDVSLYSGRYLEISKMTLLIFFSLYNYFVPCSFC